MILCAAIKVAFERDGREVAVVIPGFRHGIIWELMDELQLPPKSKRKEIEGFIDNNGEFLDRFDAFYHAKMCGQLSATVLTYKTEHFENELFSEDLY